MKIFKFDHFLNEKLGVSESSLIFVEVLEDRIKKEFINFIQSGQKKLKKDIEIGYRTLKPYIKDTNLYGKFPVVKFEVGITFNRLSEKVFIEKYPLSSSNKSKLATGGAAYYFGNRNWKKYSKIVDPIKRVSDNGIIINMDIYMDATDTFNLSDNFDSEKMIDDISSTLYHELNHCYEHYLRVVKNSSVVRPESRSFDTTLSWGANIWKIPNPIFKFWSRITNFLYFSEHHEIRANIQEVYYFLKKYPNKNLEDIRIWKNADNMEKFNSEEFYNQLLEVIGKTYPDSKEYIANKLKKMWVKTYKKECSNQGVKPVISFIELERMSCKDFLKYWQKRINKTGQTIKRKAHKIKADLNDNI